MLKRTLLLAVAAFATIAFNPSDSRAGGGVILHNGGLGSGGTIASGCTNARTIAIAAGRTNHFATAECTLTTSHGDVHVVFDGTGMAARAWTYDAAGIGHYYSATHSLTRGVRINNKNYHSASIDANIDWYTTDPPPWFRSPNPPTANPGNDPEHPDQFVMDNRLFNKRSSTRLALDPGAGVAHLIATVFASKVFEDHCLIFSKGAESTAPGVTPQAVVAHYNNDGSRTEKYHWAGGPIDFNQFYCGSYLPTSVPFVMPNVALFAEVQSTFGFTLVAAQNFLAGVYAKHGADASNPLSIFHVTHAQRLSFGLHPLSPPVNTGWLGDGWSPHAQGIIDSGLISGGFGGLLGLMGGPAGGVLGFLGGFDVSVSAAIITDIDNGIDPRTGEKPGAELEAPSPNDDELLTETDIELIADWDANANNPVGQDGQPDPSGGANDGAGSYEGGEDGGDSCTVNPNACFPQARKHL